MKARLPQGMGGGPGNIQGMLKQAQKMQEQMEEKQKELAEKEYTAAAGGGVVSVTVTGKHEVKDLTIDPEVVDPEDVEMLQDLIIAAINEAMRTAAETEAAEMEKLSGGLSMPGLPGMF